MSRCRKERCARAVFKDGLCENHYNLKQINKCIVTGCDGEYGVKGMCQKHYRQWKRFNDSYVIGSGKTLGPKFSRYDAETVKRFYAKTQRNADCLEWTGYKTSNGYGQMSINRWPALTHRMAWEIHNGPIPDGMNVCHKCDFPACVEISHLFISDDRGNQHDCIQKGRSFCLGLKGEDHLKAKLTEEQVMAIRDSDECGVVLAERYNIEQTTITDVRKGKTWQHLPVDVKHLANKSHKITDADVIAIRASGKATGALAKEYGISTRSISGLLYGETYPHLPGIHKSKGSGNFTGKLTESDVLNIRSSNESSKILAAQYNVDKSSIANIKSRRTWKHIGGQ